MAEQNSLYYTCCCCLFSSTGCWLKSLNHSPNCSLSLSVPSLYWFKIWKHECSTKQNSNWFKREKFCHAVPAITYRLYIRLINMPEQTLGELTWLSATKANAKTEIRWMRRFQARPAPPFSLPPLLCMQPIGIGIRILTMQNLVKKQRRMSKISNTRGDKHCWQSPGSGRLAGRFRLQGVMLMAEDVFPSLLCCCGCCYSSICLEADWLEAHKSSKSVRTLKLKL